MPDLTNVPNGKSSLQVYFSPISVMWQKLDIDGLVNTVKDKVIANLDDYTVIDLSKITEDDLPLITLVDDRTSFIGWAIKWHCKGTYNHAMIMHKPGYFASMDFNGFHEVPVAQYTKNNILMKFWAFDGITAAQKQMILANIATRLKTQKSWWSYDYLGLIGQALNIPWIHNPFQEFCSEEVIALTRDPLFVPAKINIPAQSSPSAVNGIFNKNRPPMKVTGYWFSE